MNVGLSDALKLVRAFICQNESLFTLFSGIDAVECGFFQYGSMGASPDALLPTKTDYILEIKTRAANQDSPLKSLDKSHIIQTQIQMLCTGKKFCILQSYHPETNCSNYFSIPYMAHLVDITQKLLNCIKNRKTISESDRWEPLSLIHEKLWLANFGQIPNFSSLRHLRSMYTQATRQCAQIEDIKHYFSTC